MASPGAGRAVVRGHRRLAFWIFLPHWLDSRRVVRAFPSGDVASRPTACSLRIGGRTTTNFRWLGRTPGTSPGQRTTAGADNESRAC